MQIDILSLCRAGNCVQARARATSAEAEISIEVVFEFPRDDCMAEAMLRARDIVLAHLDPA